MKKLLAKNNYNLLTTVFNCQTRTTYDIFCSFLLIFDRHAFQMMNFQIFEFSLLLSKRFSCSTL